MLKIFTLYWLFLLLSKWYYYINSENSNNLKHLFDNSQADQGSIPGRVIPKTQRMILDAILVNTQHYKVWIKDKVEVPVV